MLVSKIESGASNPMKIFFSNIVFVLLVLTTTAAPAQVTSAPFNVPAESAIPSGPRGDAIRKGKTLLTNTAALLPDNVGNGLTCTNCHLKGGTVQSAAPWVGLWGVFPEYRSRSAKVITLSERINDCFERSMNGKALSYTSDAMIAMLSYIQWLSTGVPTGQSVVGRGFKELDRHSVPDAASGKVLYMAKCVACHGADGEGIKDPKGGYVFPPIWGNQSFNDGAGMARTFTAAAFIKHNMPLGQEGSLTGQEALDIAQFFTHQPRPEYPGKSGDWPNGGKPIDARN